LPEQKEYIKSLIKEVKLRADKNICATTIYIGGGTPSLVDASDVARVLDEVRGSFSIEADAEVTLEANPNSLTYEKLEIYKAAGVNRISLGLQSHKNKFLQLLGRPHDYAQFKRAAEAVLRCGIANLSVDIMFGLPGQRQAHLKKTVKKAVKSGAVHISAYGLNLEFGTPLEAAVSSGTLAECDEDASNEMYKVVNKALERWGFARYEISNFAKPGFESKHNLNYWVRGEYLGFGVSAYSYTGGVRLENTHDLAEYSNRVNKAELPVIFTETETPETAEKEYIMLALRTAKGIDLYDYAAIFKKDFVKTYKPAVEQMAGSGFVCLSDGRLYIDEKHFNVSNLIIEKFF